MTLTTHTLCPDTGQPVHKGLPVPWVALWSAEFNPQQVMTDDIDPARTPITVARNHLAMFTTATDGEIRASDLVLAYADCKYTPLGMPTDDPHIINTNVRAQRDQFGLLWHRDLPGAQGKGEPQFAGLHTLRQRDCMINHRCQVCSDHFPVGEPVTFLHGKSGLSLDRTDPIITGTAPTCERCIPVAMRSCPAQRRMPRVIMRARSVQPCEIVGDVYAPWGVEAIAVKVALDDPVTLRMNCKQLHVRVSDYTLERVA